jgi:hypothetical protein
VNDTVAWDALTRARELVGQLDWDRKPEELDRVQAGIKHELETALIALQAGHPGALVNSPGLVRNDHRQTSQTTARAVSVKSGTQRAAVLLALYHVNKRGDLGLTDWELQEALQLGASSERPRRVELCRMGLVEATTVVRKINGHDQTVWAITGQGVTVGSGIGTQGTLPFDQTTDAPDLETITGLFAEPSEVKPEDAQVPEVTGSPEDLAQVRHLVLGDPHADGAIPPQRG